MIGAGAVVGGLGLVLGLVVGALALPWLRRGGHRYADESGLPPRGHTWVLPVAALAAGAVALAQAMVPLLALALALAAALLTVLAAIDVDVRRLPNAWTYRMLLVTPPVLLVLSLAHSDLGAFGRALAAGLTVGALYLVLVLAGRGTGMGMGDLKLAPTLGMLLGYLSWSHVLLGTMAGFLLGGLVAAGLLVTRRAGRKSHLAFGPWMVAGTVLALTLPVTLVSP